jgi:hypothetical protein
VHPAVFLVVTACRSVGADPWVWCLGVEADTCWRVPPCLCRMQSGIAIEIWTMNGGILFDNILVTSDAAAASAFAEKVGHTARVCACRNQRSPFWLPPGFPSFGTALLRCSGGGVFGGGGGLCGCCAWGSLQTWRVEFEGMSAKSHEEERAAERAAREAALETGGVVDKANYYILEGVDFLTEVRPC